MWLFRSILTKVEFHYSFSFSAGNEGMTLMNHHLWSPLREPVHSQHPNGAFPTEHTQQEPACHATVETGPKSFQLPSAQIRKRGSLVKGDWFYGKKAMNSDEKAMEKPWTNKPMRPKRLL